MPRPTRTATSSKKTITIRVTEDERKLLDDAAHPLTLSDWLRRMALDKVSMIEVPPEVETDPPDVHEMRAQVAMLDLKLRTRIAEIEDKTKKQAVFQIGNDIIRLFERVVRLLEDRGLIQPASRPRPAR